jgi:hypothetical protein
MPVRQDNERMKKIRVYTYEGADIKLIRAGDKRVSGWGPWSSMEEFVWARKNKAHNGEGPQTTRVVHRERSNVG